MSTIYQGKSRLINRNGEFPEGVKHLVKVTGEFVGVVALLGYGFLAFVIMAGIR